MEAVRTLEDFIENAPADMPIDASKVSRGIEPITLEDLVKAVVDARWQQKAWGKMRKMAEESLVNRLKVEGRAGVEVPPYRVTYDYPQKRLWDVDELMAMTGEEDTDTLLRIVFGKVTPGQLKALKDRFPDLEEIIESAERTGQANKKKLEIEETMPGLKEVSGGAV